MTRLSEFDVLRVISLVFIYVVHSTLMPSVGYPLALFADVFCMFISGYLAHQSMKDRSLLGFWRRKASSFLLPFWGIILVWWLTQRETYVPNITYVEYALGLRVLVLPANHDLFSLWFASCLIGYFALWSILARFKNRYVEALGAGVMVLLGIFDKGIIWWIWAYYLIPFSLGYLFHGRSLRLPTWTLPLLAVPLLLITTAQNFPLGNLLNLAAVLPLILLCLNLLMRIKVPFAEAWTCLASGSLSVYGLEPVYAMWVGWLFWPSYWGNTSVQFLILPGQSLLSLVVSLSLSFAASLVVGRILKTVRHMVGRIHVSTLSVLASSG